MSKTVSDYFPPDTSYFYGYPCGKGSGFLNLAPTLSEELVSARPLGCAGDSLRVVCFANGAREEALRILADQVGLPLISEDRIVRLPAGIDASVMQETRDNMVQDALRRLVPDGHFVMAQPYVAPLIEAKYLIPSGITNFLNDKASLTDLIPEEYLAKTFHKFSDGLEFSSYNPKISHLPCVIKVTNSSAGDGVRICKNTEDICDAQKDFLKISSPIIIQEYVQGVEEVGVQFGVPPNTESPTDILGFSASITTPQGEYLGGNFDDSKVNETIKTIYTVIEKEILPKVRKHGWYGIGGLDVLIRSDDSFVFIDGNFRMTATHAYRFNIANNLIQSPFVTMSASMDGNLHIFAEKIVPIARMRTPDRILHPINLSESGGVVRFNAGLLYDQPESLAENARHLLSLGVRSDILSVLASR